MQCRGRTGCWRPVHFRAMRIGCWRPVRSRGMIGCSMRAVQCRETTVCLEKLEQFREKTEIPMPQMRSRERTESWIPVQSHEKMTECLKKWEQSRVTIVECLTPAQSHENSIECCIRSRKRGRSRVKTEYPKSMERSREKTERCSLVQSHERMTGCSKKLEQSHEKTVC